MALIVADSGALALLVTGGIGAATVGLTFWNTRTSTKAENRAEKTEERTSRRADEIEERSANKEQVGELRDWVKDLQGRRSEEQARMLNIEVRLKECEQARNLLAGTPRQLAELRSQIARNTAITAAMPVAQIGIDQKGRVTDWNREAEALFGWTEHDILGRMMAETIMPEKYRKRHYTGVERYMSTGRALVMNRWLTEFEGLHKDGHEFPIELNITDVAVDRENLFFAVIRKREEGGGTL